MRTFGLIGYPLAHSFSKKYFTEQFERDQIADCNYELFPLEKIADLTGVLANPAISGLNVTIPYKVEVMAYLNELDAAAAAIGAVNCIAIGEKEGKPFLKGYNTDAYGFQESLMPLLKPFHQKALILGDGGAAKAVKYVLNQLQIPFITVVRKAVEGAILYEDLTEEILRTHQIIINTTPLGTFPNVEASAPIPYHFLRAEHLAYDLVYNPEETSFLQQARAQGAATKNGMEMLYLQADRSWYIWNS